LPSILILGIRSTWTCHGGTETRRKREKRTGNEIGARPRDSSQVIRSRPLYPFSVTPCLRGSSPVELAGDDVQPADDRHRVGEEMALDHLREGLVDVEAGRADLHPVRVLLARAHDVVPEL